MDDAYISEDATYQRRWWQNRVDKPASTPVGTVPASEFLRPKSDVHSSFAADDGTD